MRPLSLLSTVAASARACRRCFQAPRLLSNPRVRNFGWLGALQGESWSVEQCLGAQFFGVRCGPVDNQGVFGALCGTLSAMDERLTAYSLAHHHGVFSWADAQRFCVTPKELAPWVANDEVLRIRRNAYILQEVWEGADTDDRQRLRVRSVIHSQPTWAASHQSAFVIHQLPLHEVDLRKFDVIAPVTRFREQAKVRRHPNKHLPPSVVVSDCAVMPLAWSIAQVALRDGHVPALVALDRALHEERVDLADLRTAGASLSQNVEEAKVIDRIVALSDAKCESVGETRTRVLLLDLGLAPRSQVVIHDHADHFVGRVDFLIDDRIVIEFDGAIKYEGDDRDEVLEQQEARERRLTALGYVVVRLDWLDLSNPAVVLAKILAARAVLNAAS